MTRCIRFRFPEIAAGLGIYLAAALAGCGGYGGDGDSASSRVTSISVTPEEATITSDGMQQFEAVTRDGSGATVTGVGVTWRSSQTGVATVDSEGLATAVAAGTTAITARVDTSSIYGEGGIIVSNEASLTVTSETSVMGLVAGAKPVANGLVVLRDDSGASQAALTDAAGRFRISVAGLAPPFVLRADDGEGGSLFGAAAKPGVANVNAVTNLLVHAWYRAQVRKADAAFDGPEPPGGPPGRALESLSDAMESAFHDTLSAHGVSRRGFSFFATPYATGDPGVDRVLGRLRASVDASRIAIGDEISARHAEVVFFPANRAALRVYSGAGHVEDIPLPAGE